MKKKKNNQQNLNTFINNNHSYDLINMIMGK